MPGINAIGKCGQGKGTNHLTHLGFVHDAAGNMALLVFFFAESAVKQEYAST
jgi:hypothetical protein